MLVNRNGPCTHTVLAIWNMSFVVLASFIILICYVLYLYFCSNTYLLNTLSSGLLVAQVEALKSWIFMFMVVSQSASELETIAKE